MSVRDKVKEFESLHEKESKEPAQGKKFLFPGNRQSKKTNGSAAAVVGIPQTRSKPSVLSEFEANLEEVWSVRKNIHHSNNNRVPNGITTLAQVSSSLSVPKFNQSYSRHGALGPHQTEAPHGLNSHDINNAKTRRPPLHDNNSIEASSQARGTRPSGFLLTETMKKQTETITHTDDIFPTTKRKRTFKGGGEGYKFASDTSTHFSQDRRLPDHKLSYAQKMAEAHLKSAGLGGYTPKQSGYAKVEEDDGNSVKWRKLDDSDEFSF